MPGTVLSAQSPASPRQLLEVGGVISIYKEGSRLREAFSVCLGVHSWCRSWDWRLGLCNCTTHTVFVLPGCSVHLFGRREQRSSQVLGQVLGAGGLDILSSRICWGERS